METVAHSRDGSARLFYDDDDRLWAEGIATTPSGEKVVRRRFIGRRKAPPGPRSLAVDEVKMASGGTLTAPRYDHQVSPSVAAAAARDAALLRALSDRHVFQRPRPPITAEEQGRIDAARAWNAEMEAEQRDRLKAIAALGDPHPAPPMQPPHADDTAWGTLQHAPSRELAEAEAAEAVEEAVSAWAVIERGDRPMTFVTMVS